MRIEPKESECFPMQRHDTCKTHQEHYYKNNSSSNLRDTVKKTQNPIYFKMDAIIARTSFILEPVAIQQMLFEITSFTFPFSFYPFYMLNQTAPN